MKKEQPKRIEAIFLRQKWGGAKGNDAIDCGEVLFDATSAVLAMPLDRLQSLKDSSESTDELGRGRVSWDGPFEVTVVSEICSYFGVEFLAEISAEQLAQAQAEHATFLAAQPSPWGWVVQHEFDFEPTLVVNTEDEGQEIVLSQDIPVQRRIQLARRIVDVLNVSSDEAAGEKQWKDLCSSQNWSEESQVILFEDFLRNAGLLGQFAAHAAEVAAEENGDPARPTGSANEPAPCAYNH